MVYTIYFYINIHSLYDSAFNPEPLYFFYLISLQPAFATIWKFDASPAFHRFIGHIYSRSLVQDKLVLARHRRGVLHGYGGCYNNSSYPIFYILFLLISEKITKDKEQDEDVLSYALFPQVATDFFKYRQAQEKKVDEKAADTKNGAYPV